MQPIKMDITILFSYSQKLILCIVRIRKACQQTMNAPKRFDYDDHTMCSTSYGAGFIAVRLVETMIDKVP